MVTIGDFNLPVLVDWELRDSIENEDTENIFKLIKDHQWHILRSISQEDIYNKYSIIYESPIDYRVDEDLDVNAVALDIIERIIK